MTGVILREPQYTHREFAVVQDPYGDWRASCTCGVVARGLDRRAARAALSAHLGHMVSRLRALREELRRAADQSVSMVEEVAE
jgi:hypothetical protein